MFFKRDTTWDARRFRGPNYVWSINGGFDDGDELRKEVPAQKRGSRRGAEGPEMLVGRWHGVDGRHGRIRSEGTTKVDLPSRAQEAWNKQLWGESKQFVKLKSN